MGNESSTVMAIKESSNYALTGVVLFPTYKYFKTSQTTEPAVAGRWRPHRWQWGWWAELPLTASTRTVWPLYAVKHPEWGPSQRLGGGSFACILKTAHCSGFTREKNSTLCLIDVFILCENCQQLLVVKKPVPNQNFKLKPLENKLSWGLYLSWWVTDGFLSAPDFRELDHKSIQLPGKSWATGGGLKATGNVCPGFSE